MTWSNIIIWKFNFVQINDPDCIVVKSCDLTFSAKICNSPVNGVSKADSCEHLGLRVKCKHSAVLVQLHVIFSEFAHKTCIIVCNCRKLLIWLISFSCMNSLKSCINNVCWKIYFCCTDNKLFIPEKLTSRFNQIENIDCDLMVVGFTTTYAISAYHH